MRLRDVSNISVRLDEAVHRGRRSRAEAVTASVGRASAGAGPFDDLEIGAEGDAVDLCAYSSTSWRTGPQNLRPRRPSRSFQYPIPSRSNGDR
jgi:hypothetical protein